VAAQTIDFKTAEEAGAWRRAQLGDLLRRIDPGEQLALKVIGWGEIHSRLHRFDGRVLTLASGRTIAIEDILDVIARPRRLSAS
jgi:hypothetical protein